MDEQEAYDNKIFELVTALSLCRNVLVNNLYVIGQFVGPCKEHKETEFAIKQIDMLLRPNDHTKG